MTAAANRDLKAEVARQQDRVDDVGHTAAAGDQCRPFVDQPVVDPPGLVVVRVARCEQLAPKGIPARSATASAIDLSLLMT